RPAMRGEIIPAESISYSPESSGSDSTTTRTRSPGATRYSAIRSGCVLGAGARPRDSATDGSASAQRRAAISRQRIATLDLTTSPSGNQANGEKVPAVLRPAGSDVGRPALAVFVYRADRVLRANLVKQAQRDLHEKVRPRIGAGQGGARRVIGSVVGEAG